MTSTEDELELDEYMPEVLHGYRFDAIRPDGRIGFYGAEEASAPRAGDRPSAPGEDRRWTPAAFCLEMRHVAPYWDCGCGWHVIGELEELAEYVPRGCGLDARRYHPGHVRGAFHRDAITSRDAVVEVTAHGLMYLGADTTDTDSTVRATWLRMESRIWIRAGVTRQSVRAVRRRYPFAKVERFESLAELAEELSAAA
ncbi:MAG TPA: hypothetical protein VK083_14585 [Nocardia sp.]|uniref:hypothetical protein n=1 Tax=Nocardia sp. TaxID=1821 RepID=UPI002B4B0864|nr:hypothetical protein [Nocardia sp.]HLS78008.1 hypothetical protein [Nocardia sp.]